MYLRSGSKSNTKNFSEIKLQSIVKVEITEGYGNFNKNSINLHMSFHYTTKKSDSGMK